MRSWFLPLVITVLGLLGVLTLRSVAPQLAAQQLVYLALGLLIFSFVSQWSYHRWNDWRWGLYALLVVGLCIPLAIGQTTRGIAAWIDIGGWFSIQPSQLAIPIVGLVVAELVTKTKLKVRDFMWLGLVIGVPAILIALEPDLGTLIVYLASMGSVLFVSHLEWRWIVGAVGLAIVVAVTSWHWWLVPYQKARITSFLNTSSNQDASYNARQALIAVGSGQLLGRGLGQGIQSHLRFLPERQTDFIFASLAEELGFSGAAVVVISYGLLLWSLHRIADHSTDAAASYYCYAISGMIMVQVMINIGMNMGLVPITGITLPFVSYGGSSFLAVSLSFGVVQAISRWHQQLKELHLT